MRHLPLFATLSLLCLLSTRAEAKKTPIIGWGEKIAEVADLPEGFEKEGYKLGLHYNSIRLIFIPLVSWDKKLVIFSDAKQEYLDLSAEDVAALEKSIGSLSSKGGLYANWVRYGNWLWPVLIGLFVAKKVTGRSARGPLQSRDQTPIP